MEITEFVRRHFDWSNATFGPEPRFKGTIAHLRKELLEIEADPTDLVEWIDVILLALDGAKHCGSTPEEVETTLRAKQAINAARKWPDWREANRNKPIEHVREGWDG